MRVRVSRQLAVTSAVVLGGLEQGAATADATASPGPAALTAAAAPDESHLRAHASARCLIGCR
ncbi:MULTISPECIES: hypothetical protein [unclassified Streptomyces]|uniref:hypothetical protein n=1 Tax=unclassified Streptomyces TaxID=2593676 RepID=UPI0038276B51